MNRKGGNQKQRDNYLTAYLQAMYNPIIDIVTTDETKGAFCQLVSTGKKIFRNIISTEREYFFKIINLDRVCNE